MKSLFLAAMLAFSLPAPAQETRTQPVVPDTIHVGGEGKFDAVPDTAVISFTIAAQENTPEAAYARAAKAAEQMRQALSSSGVDPKSAELGHYSLHPVHDYRKPRRPIVAFRVTTSVSVKLKDFSKVGPLTQKLAVIDDTENQSVGYTLENVDAAKNRAAEDAFRKARASAETVAKAAGRTLGELVHASVDISEPQPIYPVAMAQTVRAVAMETDAAAPPPPTQEFSPQKISVTSRVTALFRMK